MTSVFGAPTLDDALDLLSEQVAAAEERGEKNLIFCEDRLTLLSERAVLKAVGGTFSTEVTTFSRFLTETRVLSKEGSVMEISAILAEESDKLVCFRERAAQAVYETIAQLSASRVTPELLRLSAPECGGALQNKLNDLAFLFEEYRRRLGERGLLDENDYLALLPEALSFAGLGQVNVFFFGFRSFTQQALEGVRAALVSARSVTGIFLAGRAELYTNECARAFRRTAEEFGEIRVAMRKDSTAGAALVLRDGLFSPERLAMPPVPTNSVFRFSAADETEELRTVAALVLKHIAEGARFRDVAVLVPDEESFFAVEQVFTAFRIPFFADKKRTYESHPFCAFALDVLDAVFDGVLPEEADAVASSLYFGKGDEYRNYLLKYGGYRGAVRREIKKEAQGYDIDLLSACRERMLAILKCFPRKGKGAAFVEGVRALRALTDADAVTEGLSGPFTAEERQFLALDRLDGVLGQIELIADGRTFTAREFARVLRSGLAALNVSMIPQYADAVFVGDATESKFARVKILFATGLTDALPRTSQDTAVITDGEIGKLSALRVEIEPAIAQVNARARESLALNLCSFTQTLYLSCSVRRGGAETERSEIFRYAERLFSLPPMPEIFPYDCCEEGPATLRLLASAQEFETGRGGDGGKFSALYKLMEERGCRPERLFSNGKKAVPEAGKLVFGGDVSPTLLESYFECPYASFATRALRLREREERTVLDADAGSFVHAVLERVADRFNRLPDETACRALAREIAQGLLSERFSALLDTAAGGYTAERLLSESAEVCAAAYRQLARSAFRVKETEGRVRLPELSLSGKTDRIDVSDEFVRVIDYKTGSFDATPVAYYTGRKLQLELYLRAAAGGGRAAGAFYFPAREEFTASEEEKYRMSGFYSGEDEVLLRMDPSLEIGQKSLLFDGKRDGKFSDRGMSSEDFEAFLDYSLLLSRRAENEIKAGNISPSPYEGACARCKLRSLCGFVGTPRKERAIKCAEIGNIVRRERGEK